ncbi:MAG: hypothetical protein JWM80_3188 [Cyanobacteria bacterium RYN_339]|nr:hypothetical protein [Cyanobacteria bacterium RYN_339]
MIQAEIRRDEEVLMKRTFGDPTLTLEVVMQRLEAYVVDEGLNFDGECIVRVRYTNLARAKAS